MQLFERDGWRNFVRGSLDKTHEKLIYPARYDNVTHCQARMFCAFCAKIVDDCLLTVSPACIKLMAIQKSAVGADANAASPAGDFLWFI
jgi:hypothetical protein